MTLAKVYQPSFTGGELAPSLYARIDLAKYRTGAKQIYNFVVQPHGGVRRRGGMEFVGEVKDSAQATRIVPFEASTDDTYILEFGHLYMRVYRNGILVMTGPVAYEMTTPYVSTELRRLVFEQANDILTVTHPGYEPREIARYDHDDWQITTLNFAPTFASPGTITVTPQTNYTQAPDFTQSGDSGYMPETHIYTVTAVDDTGQESAPATESSTLNDLRYQANLNVVTWPAVTDAAFYNVYRKKDGIWGLVGTTPSTLLSFTDKNYVPDVSQTPPSSKDPFTGTGRFPRASAFYQQRRIMGGTIRRPQTTWATQSAAINNMSKSSPARDSDALEFTIAAKMLQKIRYYLGLQDLIIFTENGEWRVKGGQDGVMTPSSIDPKPQSFFGIGDVPPLIVGDAVLFVRKDGKQVRDLGYKYETDSYTGSDLSVLSAHLFKNRTVLDWSYAQYPDSVIWCVMSDGLLCSLTYMREHEVWGWSQHATDGVVENVAVVREDGLDALYLVVRRLIGGVWRRYIERIRAGRADSRVAAFYVDCGLSYVGGPEIQTITNLQHLEGKTIVGVADGAVVGMDESLVVNAGKITLPRPATVIHLGLPYESKLQSLTLTPSDESAIGRSKATGRVNVHVEGTSGIEVGTRFDNMNEHKARSFEPYSTAPELKTEILQIAAPDTFKKNGGEICVRQRYPLPTTILALQPEIDYGG